jgi:hypothetical protein
LVLFELHTADDTLLGTVDLELPPFGSGQLSDAISQFGEVAAGYVVAWSGSPGARFVPYASVVDTATGDPAFVAPSSALTGAAVIPAVASLPGAQGSYWRSGIVLLNLGATTASIRLGFAERELDHSGDLPTATLEVEPGRQLMVADLVASLFGLTAAGALHLEVEEGEVFAASRTWTAAGDGAFGQDVPAIPVEQAIVTSESALMVGLRESCDLASGYRTNLGLVNLGPGRLTVTIDASHGDGTPVGTRVEAVPSRGAMQLGRIFARLGQCDVRNGVIEVSTAAPDARFVSYASVVDNGTGDPVFITATSLSHVGR